MSRRIISDGRCAQFVGQMGRSKTKRRRRDLLRAVQVSVERLECRQLLAGTPGLTVAAYHLGGGNSNANDALFGGTNAALVRVANFAATNTPNYTFVDTKDAFNFSGDSGAMTPVFLGDDAAGAALTDADNQNDTIYDAEGFFIAPTAGTYTFSIGNGANNQADDICGIYVGGNGTAGSGTLVAADGWQGATSPFSVDPANTPGTATFTLPAGNIPVEIIYGNGFGGAFLNGVSITDPTMNQVAYVTSAAAPAPAAPTLNAPALGDGQVTLSWNSVLFASSYSVFRSDPAHPTATSIASGITGTTYTDKSVTAGVSYTYYVEAVNSSGTSAPSNTQTVTATATPATPLNFTASRVGGTPSVALSWTAAPNAPASTKYDVMRGTSLNGDGTLGGTIVDVTPGGISATNATDANAATNTTYYYAVTATSSGGTSAPSAAVKVSAVSPVATALASEGTVEVDVRAIDLPAGPVNSWANEGASGGTFTPFGTAAPTVGAFTDSNGITYQAVNFNGSTALTSSFNAPADLTGNSARSIEVWVLNPTIDTIEETMVSWAHRGGPDGTNESFSYGSTYAVGEWGAEYDMTWAGSAAAGAPTTAPPANVWHNLTFTYDGNLTEDVYVDGQLQLTGASNGMPIAAQLATAVGLPINLAAQNNAGVAAILGSLDIAAVRISNGALTAADVLQNFKAGVPGQTPPSVAPAAAPVLAKPVVNGGLVQLSWSYVGDSGTGFGYNVFRSDAAHPTPVAVASNLTATSYTDSSVSNGVQYTYFVVAHNSAGSGPASNSQTATPTPTAPATPTNFTASRIGISSNVATSWTASQFATSYDVKRGTALNPDGTLGGTITDLTPSGISGTNFTDTSAPISSDSYYTVTASNAGGTSAPTTPVLVAKLTAATGLEDFAYHLGGGNSNAFNNVFGGDNAALNRVANFAATNAPNYSFLNSATQFMYSGDSGAATAAFLGNDASGAALTDPFNQNDTIYDAEGYFVAPTAGTYTFQIGNGSNNQADDICGIYVGGNGTPGSGTLVAADGWQGATSPFGTNVMTTPGMATFTLPAGNIPVEIIYGNGFGGAFLDGVSITDPSSKQVAYTTLATASFQDVISGTSGNDAITLTKDADGTDIDWTLNGGPAVKASANDLTIIGNGGTDTITLDSSNGSPMPAMLHLNQSTGGRFVIAGLTQTSGYKMDIENSTVQINYSGASPLSSIQANLKSGAIFSSTLASAKFGIADTDSADPLNSGQPANTIVLRPALIGNATLSGKVGFNDFVQLARNYGKNNADWAMGDFDYDGKVDFADLVALARNYGASAAAAGAASAFASAHTLTPAAALLDILHNRKTRHPG